MRLFIIFIFSMLLALPAYAEVHIADTQGAILPPIEVNLGPGQVKWYLIGRGKEQGWDYKIALNVDSLNPVIEARICDDNNLKRLLGGQDYKCFNAKGGNRFILEGNDYSPTQHYLVFDNRNGLLLPKKVTAFPYVQFQINENEKQVLKNLSKELMETTQAYFEVSEFDIAIIPCEQENAFSTPDIIMCSELFMSSFSKDNLKVFAAIFMHELGHSLLNLWDNPNYANEKTADEFALALMLMTQNHAASADIISVWAHWFAKNENLQSEIYAAYKNEDQHQLTVQRLNNINSILTNREEFLQRWANVLYPHMTDKALDEIIDNPYEGANIELAEKILDSR